MRCVCDVIVLCWNRVELTKKFVNSFLDNTTIPSRLIIIDNASDDGTKEYLQTLKDVGYFKIEVIFNGENRGFVEGMNQGIRMSNAPYVCLANNDLIFTNGWLSEMTSIFERYQSVGVLNPNSNNLGTKLPRGVSLDSFALDLRSKYKGVFIEMPFCIGFCMAIRREVIEKVGGLSEEFYPMFFEDTDYSMKAQKAGYLIGMAKSSYVWHQEHASFKHWQKEKKEFFFSKSRDVFLRKWGKILRVAWIVNSYEELLENIDKAIKLVREGNFVWILTNSFNVKREDVFSGNDNIDHSGIKFVRFTGKLNLMWKIIKKKKRFDLIICRDQLINLFLKKLKYKVSVLFDKDEVDRIKRIYG